MNTAPPVLEKKGLNASHVRMLVYILLGVAVYMYFRSPHLQTPHFRGSKVSSIDIVMRTRVLPPAEPKVLVQASITSAPDCASLFRLLRSAGRQEDHKCDDIGSFTIRYANGKTDALQFLPGHDPTGYEFRFGEKLYRLPRERLYQVLRDAGVDTAKIPVSEH
jgi:hypothetical protein